MFQNLQCTNLLLKKKIIVRTLNIRSTLLKTFYLFIYFWLCWIFVLAWTFLQLKQVGPTVSLQCLGLSCCRGTSCKMHGLQWFWFLGSRARAQKLWRVDLVDPQHVESSWTRDLVFLDPRLSSALADGFLNTEPPGNPLIF